MVGIMLDKILMNNAELTEWRENLKSDLSVVRNDVEWIKDNLGRMDVRQADLTKQVSWLRGLGSVVGIILGSVLALVSSIVLGGG
jgi:hypothetical protein